MIDLIQELKEIMSERGISPESASRYIGCAAKSVYRWIYDESKPSMIYSERIRQAIKQIKKDFPLQDQTREGYALLVSMKKFIPNLKFKSEFKAAKILPEMTVDDLGEIFVSGIEKETAILILNKYGIEAE